MSDEIHIRFPINIPEELRNVSGLSDAQKQIIAERIKKLPKSKKKEKYNQKKLEMIYEILTERAKFNSHMTKNEILDILECDNNLFSPYITKLMGMATSNNEKLVKFKRKNITCYKL